MTIMDLNRQELYEYMDDVAENMRNKTNDVQNKLVLEKIEKVFEYMKEKVLLECTLHQKIVI